MPTHCDVGSHTTSFPSKVSRSQSPTCVSIIFRSQSWISSSPRVSSYEYTSLIRYNCRSSFAVHVLPLHYQANQHSSFVLYFSPLTFLHILDILDMHPLTAASCAILLETEPKLFVLKLRTMHSVDDIALNLSLRKLSKHEYS